MVMGKLAVAPAALLDGLTTSCDLMETGPEDGWSSALGDALTGTLANLRFAGVYSQGRLAASQRLHLGRSPEHFVLWE